MFCLLQQRHSGDNSQGYSAVLSCCSRTGTEDRSGIWVIGKACKKGFELLRDFNCTAIDFESGVKLWKGFPFSLFLFFQTQRCLLYAMC